MSLSVSKSWLDSMSGTLNRQDDLTVTFQLENCDSVDVIENKLNEFSETYHNEQNIQKTINGSIYGTLIEIEASNTPLSILQIGLCTPNEPLSIPLRSMWQEKSGVVHLDSYECSDEIDKNRTILFVPESLFDQWIKSCPDTAVYFSASFNNGQIEQLEKTLNDEDWPVTTPVYIRNHVQENLEFDQQQFKFYSLVIGLCSTVFVIVILIIYSILSQLHESSRIWIEQQRKLGYSLKQICKERMRIIHQMVFLAVLTSIFILLITNHSIASLISALFISLFTWIILIFLQKKIIK